MAEYRSARVQAWLATFGLAAAATVQVFVAALRAYVAVFAPESRVGYALAAGLGGLLFSLTSIVAGVTFILWLRRAVVNTLALGTSVRLVRRDAILSWFVPLLNLVAPYRVVSSVYRANAVSDRDVAGDWVQRMPMLLPLWWGSWLVTLFLRALSAPTDDSFRTRETATTWAGVAAVPFTLLAATAAIIVLWSIQSRLEERARTATEPAPAFEPPPHLRASDDEDDNDEDDDDDEDT